MKDLTNITHFTDAFVTKATFCFAASWATFSAIFNKYIFSNWDFALILAIFVSLDTATGIWKAWKLKKVNSNRLGGVFSKLILYAIVLAITHGMTTFGSDSLAWAQEGIFAFLLIREGLSVLENVSVIHPGILPKSILTRLAAFDDESNPQKPSGDA